MSQGDEDRPAPGTMAQNFFWVTLGTAVRSNEEMKRHLTHAGFEVVLDDPAAQGEPAGAN